MFVVVCKWIIFMYIGIYIQFTTMTFYIETERLVLRDPRITDL